MSEDLQLMMSRIAHLEEISGSEASRIVNEVYRDGIVSREEAELLFQMNDRLEARDVNWSSRFIEAVTDFLLTRESPVGFVTQEEANWLQAQVERDDHIATESEIDLLLSVLRHADGAPDSLAHFCLKAISRRIIDAGHADEAMAERMRRVLHAPAGDGSISITRHEANVLFETNDAIARSTNSKAWDNVFAKAILNHLVGAAHPDPMSEKDALSREAWLKDTDTNVGGFFSKMANAFTSGTWFDKISYSDASAARARSHAKQAAVQSGKAIVASEKNWIMRRLGWDKSVSPAERKLFHLLKEDAPAFARGLAEAVKKDEISMPS